MDAKKVDFVNTDRFHFQSKLSINTPSVQILDQMPEGFNVILWGKVQKANKNFMLQDEYVICKLDDFIKLL